MSTVTSDNRVKYENEMNEKRIRFVGERLSNPSSIIAKTTTVIII